MIKPTKPCAAAHVWPYPGHRTMEQVMASEARIAHARSKIQTVRAASWGKETAE